MQEPVPMSDTMPQIAVREIAADGMSALAEALSDVLCASVDAGAAVNFFKPLSRDQAGAYWTGEVVPALAAGQRHLFVADCAGVVAGTVQLDTDMPANQLHRAEVAKLLVHPAYRRRGIAQRLMQALIDRARDLGRTLITLETRTDDPAVALYQTMGFEIAGSIPHFSLNPEGTGYDAATYMFKRL